jgi:uncharacterized protein GlcG (DUF336 family)
MPKFLTKFGIVFALLSNATFATQLSLGDVQQIMAEAVTRASQISSKGVIAIVDREGYVLGVWDVNGGTPPSAAVIAGAVSRAGTAAFLSSNQNAFTSRTAGFIIQQHFPPKVRNTPPGPLVGVGLSNLFYSDVTFLKQCAPGFDPNSLFNPLNPYVSPGTFGTSVAGTSLNDTPGGVPLYKDGELVGGLGVTGDGSPIDISTGFAILTHKTQSGATPGFKVGSDRDESVALAGQAGFEPDSEILATNDILGGIRIPYVDSNGDHTDAKPLGSIGKVLPAFPLQASPPPFNYEKAQLGGVDGEIRFPFRDDPTPGSVDGASRLTKDQVRDIISLAAERAGHTRAGIRLPVPVAAQTFIAVVGNPNQNDVAPPILGVFRTGEATMFSWDVAVQKARTALFFSTYQFAQSTRSVGFLAQRFFPPGLDGRSSGPYFGIQEALFFAAASTKSHPNKNVPNGITIFPGGFPLYRDGKLIGAIGVSGDGVDQDDIIAASGCIDYLPPIGIRSDQYLYRGARLPYAKFPRDPDL